MRHVLLHLRDVASDVGELRYPSVAPGWLRSPGLLRIAPRGAGLRRRAAYGRVVAKVLICGSVGGGVSSRNRRRYDDSEGAAQKRLMTLPLNAVALFVWMPKARKSASLVWSPNCLHCVGYQLFHTTLNGSGLLHEQQPARRARKARPSARAARIGLAAGPGRI